MPLHNNTAEDGTDCPSGGGAYWHFVIAPNTGYHFVEIHLNIGGSTYNFSGAQIIAKGAGEMIHEIAVLMVDYRPNPGAAAKRAAGE